MKNDETGPETPVVDPIRDGGTGRPPGGGAPGEAGASATLAERLQTTGAELVRSLRAVLSALPTAPTSWRGSWA
jgi:hypothetical protein